MNIINYLHSTVETTIHNLLFVKAGKMLHRLKHLIMKYFIFMHFILYK